MSMGQSDDAVETSGSFVWVDDGIIHIRSKGVLSTPDTVAEVVAAVGDLTGGEARPALLDFREWHTDSPEPWQPLISTALSFFTAAAFVVDRDSAPRIGEYPEIIHRLLIPFGVFTDESEALRFLRSHDGRLPDE